MTKKQKCECPDIGGPVSPERERLYSKEEKSGMNHKSGKCKGTNNIIQYQRGNKKLWLCSCCNMPRDIELTN